MIIHPQAVLVCLLWLTAGVACSREAPRATAESVGGAVATDTMVHTGADTLKLGAVSPRAVQWDAAQLIGTLEGAGLVVRRTQPLIQQPFLAVPGIALTLADSNRRDVSAELQAYFYGDALTATRDIAQLDTVRVAPPTMQITWRLPPRLIVDNNLVLVPLTQDATLAARVAQRVRRSELPLPARR